MYLDAGIPKLGLSSDGSAQYTLSGTVAVLADEWTHVAAVRTGSAVKLVVNDSEHTSSGMPLGDVCFVRGLERRYDRRLRPGKGGWPKGRSRRPADAVEEVA